jgi:hypothetical protein
MKFKDIFRRTTDYTNSLTQKRRGRNNGGRKGSLESQISRERGPSEDVRPFSVDFADLPSARQRRPSTLDSGELKPYHYHNGTRRLSLPGPPPEVESLLAQTSPAVIVQNSAMLDSLLPPIESLPPDVIQILVSVSMHAMFRETYKIFILDIDLYDDDNPPSSKPKNNNNNK